MKARIIWITMLIFIVMGLHLVYDHPRPTQAPDALPVAITAPDKQITLDDLLDAIEQVESGGDANAVGDDGKAVGSFQIHKIYVDDVNRIQAELAERNHYGFTAIRYEWRNDKNLCRDMVDTYLRHYATMRRIGKRPTFEDMARIHNGGPNGWKKESTLPYWEKVKVVLK